MKWTSWCTLCAVDAGCEIKLDTITKVVDIVKKYIRISIPRRHDWVICQECLALLLNVEKFVLRCAKVNEMYLELAKGSYDVASVRDTYGLSKSLEYINCESNQIEAKSEPHPEESDIEEPGSNYAVGNAGEENNEDDTASYTSPDIDSTKNEPEAAPQPKSRMRKICIEAKSKQSAKKRHNTTDSQHESSPKSIKRKPILGTDLCQFCDIIFQQPRRYMEHMRNKHSPNVLSFVCQCGKFFVSEKKMLRHAECHRPVGEKKIHPCPECDRTFTRADNVQMHIRIVHDRERPFVCEECGKAYATKAALKEHKVSHSDLRPFRCTDCSMCFKDLRALQRHSVRHSAFVRSFECLQCGQRLNTLQTLRNHMMVHSDEKRHKCQQCGNAYKRYKTLKAHLITHTGLRPYACPFCEVTYANGSNLRTHKKKFHPLELAAFEAAGQVKLTVPNVNKQKK